MAGGSESSWPSADLANAIMLALQLGFGVGGMLLGAAAALVVRRQLARVPLLSPDVGILLSRCCWGLGLIPALALILARLGLGGVWLGGALLITALGTVFLARSWLSSLLSGAIAGRALAGKTTASVIVDGRRYLLTAIARTGSTAVAADGTEIMLPNKVLAQLPIMVEGGIADGVPGTRFEISLSLSARNDARRAAQVLHAAVAGTEGVALEPPPRVLLKDIQGSDAVFLIVATARSRDDVDEVASRARFAVLDALRLTGITLPHTQQDVHLRDLDTVKAALAMALEERRRSQQSPQ